MEMTLRLEQVREPEPELTRGEALMALSERSEDVWAAAHQVRLRLNLTWAEAWLLVNNVRARGFLDVVVAAPPTAGPDEDTLVGFDTKAVR